MGGSSSKQPTAVPPQPRPAVPPQPRPAVPPQPRPAVPPQPRPAVPPQPRPAASPKPNIIAAKQIIHHNVNNYIIPNITVSADVFEQRSFTVQPGSKVDRYMIKVCARHLSRKGCLSKYCYRFHVCQFWIRDSCKKEDCSFDHHFNAQHNCSLLEHLLSRKFGVSDLEEKLKRNFYPVKAMKEDQSICICIDNVLKQCKRVNCQSFHIDSPYSWEMFAEGKWIQFPRNQNEEIEESFCDPHNSYLVLDSQPLRNKTRNKDFVDRVLSSQNTKIDFENMTLTFDNSFCRVRRLSTPSDVGFFKTVATRWLWFWEGDDGSWNFYRNAVVNNFTIIPFSDYIESEFIKRTKNFSFEIIYINFIINLETMTWKNESTSTSRRIRRRPMGSPRKMEWKGNKTFLSLWKNPKSSGQFLRQEVPSSSPEFHFVKQMVTKTVSVDEIRIERIENPHLWQAYQLKKSQMLKSYNGDTRILNEQYLFHGTSISVLDKICSENLDWRLYGSNVGNAYGRGTYFANSARISNSYTRRDEEGYRYIFIAHVLVGTAAVGHSSMTLPPVDPNTNKRFDTTVNDSVDPEIFIKYNLDDYYPAYLVKFK